MLRLKRQISAGRQTSAVRIPTRLLVLFFPAMARNPIRRQADLARLSDGGATQMLAPRPESLFLTFDGAPAQSSAQLLSE
ncbi:hypothetical protein [Brucella sp. NBRC 12953]|uniref:hypothetical protein n=1 Tax=Brucella sp. NBRC 12953 TaxID=3075481 RepID=UPI000DE2AB70